MDALRSAMFVEAVNTSVSLIRFRLSHDLVVMEGRIILAQPRRPISNLSVTTRPGDLPSEATLSRYLNSEPDDIFPCYAFSVGFGPHVDYDDKFSNYGRLT